MSDKGKSRGKEIEVIFENIVDNICFVDGFMDLNILKPKKLTISTIGMKVLSMAVCGHHLYAIYDDNEHALILSEFEAIYSKEFMEFKGCHI